MYRWLVSKTSLIIACSLGLILSTSLAYADCSGCLCPGDPCKLCPLPAMQDVPPKPNEHELCARIRESVPPTLAQPGSNEFPSRVYCKPPKVIKN
jgi:hypothetical protein